jgi:hypothetical protein
MERAKGGGGREDGGMRESPESANIKEYLAYLSPLPPQFPHEGQETAQEV